MVYIGGYKEKVKSWGRGQEYFFAFFMTCVNMVIVKYLQNRVNG